MSHPPQPPTGYILHEGYPSVPSYLHLRSASGLTPKTTAMATAALSGSWCGCYITTDSDNTPIAMGRIIGDGGWYFHIADMAVLPEHQRRGLGDAVLKRLLWKIKAEVPREEKEGEEGRAVAYVSLFADEAGRKLYANNGFVDAAPKQMGMVILV
ncbi:GNAT family N-acetyltransferase [Paecilomyces variotii No. 5]|uniref:GNAT family N-acetyltransferase n=1 Tax=Byssochlamys spectabilis (strain No. 5 / NBRC 109023) TaxID=1356009 RepID=V5FQ37_BYSSN|nr:GNAT family N-acetyltransferase [Paecilomyces variotii No. 5]